MKIDKRFLAEINSLYSVSSIVVDGKQE